MDPTPFLATGDESIREVIARIDRGARGIVLLVNKSGRLHATITDGDIRRAVLSGCDLDEPVATLLAERVAAGKVPITANLDTPIADQIELMETAGIRHLPLLDEHGRVVELALLEELRPARQLPIDAVIMAGGFGTRLRPLTDDVPKPMLPVGGTPLLERTVEQLRRSGIQQVNLTTHYLPEKITSHFGNGDRFGVDIKYVSEERPLGTAGALHLLENTDRPLLVMNGDILTQIDFQELVSFHEEHDADLTLAVRQYEFKVPYGVVDADRGHVTALREKPSMGFLVNAGIYLLQPTVLQYIPADSRFDMTDLIDVLLANGRTVVSFPVLEYWLDIGQHEDFVQAQQDAQELGWAA